jgi:hypothetical protein
MTFTDSLYGLRKGSNLLDLSSDKIVSDKPSGEIAIALVRTLGSVLKDNLFVNERHLDVISSKLSDITDYSSFVSPSMNKLMASIVRQGNLFYFL